MLNRVVDQTEKLVRTLTGLSRNKHEGRVGHKTEIHHKPFGEFLHGFSVLFHGVPLIYGDNACLSLLVGISRYFAVLLCESLRCVYHDNAHVGSVYRHIGSQDAVFFHIVIDLRFSSYSRRVNQQIFFSVIGHRRVHRVSCGSRFIRDYNAVFPRNFIYQRRFPCIGFSDNRHLYGVVVGFFFGNIGHIFENGVKQIARTVAVNRGNGYGVA